MDGAVHPVLRASDEVRPAWRNWAWAAAVSLLCLLVTTSMLRPGTLRDYDQPLYLSVAYDLLTTGEYTNGRRVMGMAAEEAAPPERGAYTAPLYPAFLSVLLRLDPSFAASAACVRTVPDSAIRNCPDHTGTMATVQAGLALLTLLAVWRTILAVGGTPLAGILAVLAAGLLCSQYAVYARTAMTEALSLPLTAWMGYGLVRLVQTRRWLQAAGTGVLLGLLILTRPEALYVALAILPCAAVLAFRHRALATRLLLVPVLALALVAPWCARNQALTGHFAPTYGYGGFILGQRVAYDAMTPGEWLASWTYPLPGFGPALTRLLFAPENYQRLGWEDRPDTFYMVGNTAMLAELRREAPEPGDQVGYLLRRHILPDGPRFAAVTVVMAWKSLWVRKYFSLVTVPFFIVFAVRSFVRWDPARVAFLAPLLFLLLLHAAASVATPRYSLMLIPAYAAAFALALDAPLRKVWAKVGAKVRRT